MKQPSLFDDPGGFAPPATAKAPAGRACGAPLFDPPAPVPPEATPDQAARAFAVDPANDVVLEASAGTGKTRVLVARYARLIEAGVDPRHILAMTFTRKAAAEMRDRVLVLLRRRAEEGGLAPERWRDLQDRIGDIQISTIDAFCFSLLREFPLEADVDPGFEIADETEMARFANEALDLTLRAARPLVQHDENVRLLFTRVKQPVLRDAIGALLDRRHVALPAVAEFVRRQATAGTAVAAASAFVHRLRDRLDGFAGRSALIDDGPLRAPEFAWLHADLTSLDDLAARLASGDAPEGPARVQQLRRRLERYFLTKNGDPRKKLGKEFGAGFVSSDAKRRHEQAVKQLAPGILEEFERLDAAINGLLSRGLLRLLTIAGEIYERLLEEHALLDFAGMLARSVALLERQEEFARSRLKLQARHHHVLVDEFQDTSRLQWRLVELLVDAWGEGEGIADAPTSIFVVGDRKQSIYRFRHAEVTLLDEATRKIGALRGGRAVRQAITASFRAVPELLAFVNAAGREIQSDQALDERFTYGEADRFDVPPVAPGALRDGQPVLGIVASPSMAASAAAVADEIHRLLATELVRDRSGSPRPARPDDVAILFRARAGHQYFEEALEARGIRTYVYKGLGFFDAPEVQDLQALLRFLAQPESDLRAAELLRSRFLRLSDTALTRLAPAFSASLLGPDEKWQAAGLEDLDRDVLARARLDVGRWLSLTDRIPASELIDLILRDSAYAFEMRGRRLDQARENLKKVRALVRRVENRGYATAGRLAEYFDTLRAGDESNAIVEAAGAVNLMTIHAAKGLEFPIVFVVNLHVGGRGRPGGFSVIDRGPDGSPEVAFNATTATRLEELREAEELRRLFYVAVTRARDRLYLTAEIDRKGKLRRSARSLAALLPAGLGDVFANAALPEGDRVSWDTPLGSFAFRVCRPPAELPPLDVPPIDVIPIQVALEGTPLVTAERPISNATDSSPGAAAGRSDVERSVMSRERLAGTLVHRLLQRGLDPGVDAAGLLPLVPQLLRTVEVVDVDDFDALASDAIALYRRLRGHEDLVEMLRAGECHYEVPFSFELPDRPGELVRGVIDCLVRMPDGRVTVIEFKTGAHRPEHGAQAGLYARAVASALAATSVDVRVLYPQAPARDVPLE
ncbi:MAG TPA: UvrD-helicase domain-containing protein [Vicinamibacterales bacterium]